MGTKIAIVSSPNRTYSGDDVYAKPVEDADGYAWDEDNWGDDVLFLAEVGTSNTFRGEVDDLTNYHVYRNTSSLAFTADAGTDTFASAGHTLSNSFTVFVRGADLPEGLAQSTLYYVVNANQGAGTFQLSASDSGPPIDISDAGSGLLELISLDARSISDELVWFIPRESEPVELVGEGEQTTRGEAQSAQIGQLVKLATADDILILDGGVYKLAKMERGTETLLAPLKTAKQPDGSNLTDPGTQRLAGYQEE